MALQQDPSPLRVSPAANPAPLSQLMLGREADLDRLKARLGVYAGDPGQAFTAIHGWPGVGKTTLIAALVADPEIARAYPDGVLWASLGQSPSVFGALAAWGRALIPGAMAAPISLDELSAQLRTILRQQRRLLIVDDVWEADHARPFDVGGENCALVLTTRSRAIAETLAATPADVYLLRVLSDNVALNLLRTLAPKSVSAAPELSMELVRDLEGLPLAIQVAGHLLHSEAGAGTTAGLTTLIEDIRQGAALLEAQAPADRLLIGPTTVNALLQTSTDRLDAEIRDRFAYLGAFAPKPATFDAAALRAVWDVADAQPLIDTLLDRGLLEPLTGGRFWLHAVLKFHALSLLED